LLRGLPRVLAMMAKLVRASRTFVDHRHSQNVAHRFSVLGKRQQQPLKFELLLTQAETSPIVPRLTGHDRRFAEDIERSQHHFRSGDPGLSLVGLTDMCERISYTTVAHAH